MWDGRGAKFQGGHLAPEVVYGFVIDYDLYRIRKVTILLFFSIALTTIKVVNALMRDTCFNFYFTSK